MNLRLTLPVQWSLTLLLGLLLGYIFRPADLITEPVTLPIATIVPTSPAVPFVTFPGGILVRVKFFRTEPPRLVKVMYLEQARLTIFPIGDDRIELLDEVGEVLYSQRFQIEFLDGDPPRPVDSKTVIFILPFMEAADEVSVFTSNGMIVYELSDK